MKRYRSVLFSDTSVYGQQMAHDNQYPVPRVGRPRREDVGDVDARILAAATELFLDQGVAATSCDAVAARARIGKASLYARYSGKNALFEAVVKHAVETTAFLPEITDLPTGSMRSRLAIAGTAVLLHALSPIPLEMMRLLLSEARRNPALIVQVDSLARARVVEIIARSLGEEISSEPMRKKVGDMVERFLDLTFAPLILAGLLGHQAGTSTEAVDRQIDFAMDALEHAGLLEHAAATQ